MKILTNQRIYVCASCNGHFLNVAAALKCCPPCECGKPRAKHRTTCAECEERARIERWQAQFDAAEIKTEADLAADGPYMLCDGDDYYESVEDYLERFEEDDDPLEWLFVARYVPAYVDADDIATRIEEGMYEDAEVPYEARAILEAACASANEILEAKRFGHFEASYKRKVSTKGGGE